MNFQLSGNIVDVLTRTIQPGILRVEAGRIQDITYQPGASYDRYLLPGFIDAHIHIESSLLVPTEFARLATIHGTVAAVSDPHEIANVLGLAGVRFMLANARQTPFTIAFGAPSCVPATPFETAGATLSLADLETLFRDDRLTYLSEMMNFPGVLAGDAEVMAKLQLAQRQGRLIDGHAPGLRGDAVQRYAAAQISTDHECFTLAEAEEKLAAGIKILIREGSAAKNYAALHSLIGRYPDRCMFCSDDRHPHDLVQGHMNTLVQRSRQRGYDLMDILQVACVNPVQHYGLPVGLLQVGDPADFIVVTDLEDFAVQQTYCRGQLVAEQGHSCLPFIPVTPINHFAAQPITPDALRIPARGPIVRVIEAMDGQLVTHAREQTALIQGEEVVADRDRDILKLTVVNRYQAAPPAIALIHGFGLQRGAIAASIAHDSHNIVAVGTNDADLCTAVNAVIRSQGGMAVVAGDQVEVLPLPIAGLMSDQDGETVAAHYAHIEARAKALGTPLSAPFMTLSFMALLVIPELKLSDRGLFNSQDFEFVSLFVSEFSEKTSQI